MSSTDTLIKGYRDTWTGPTPTCFSRLPPPRPGPPLDECTQGTTTATPVYRGWALHPELFDGAWKGYFVNADETHARYLLGSYTTAEGAAQAMRKMIDEEIYQEIL